MTTRDAAEAAVIKNLEAALTALYPFGYRVSLDGPHVGAREEGDSRTGLTRTVPDGSFDLTVRITRPPAR